MKLKREIKDMLRVSAFLLIFVIGTSLVCLRNADERIQEQVEVKETCELITR